MVRVDAAPRAEVVLRRAGIEPVNSQRLFAGVERDAADVGRHCHRAAHPATAPRRNVFRGCSLWPSILGLRALPSRRAANRDMTMNSQETKLQAAENDLKQLMANVTRAMEKAHEAVGRIASKAVVATAETESTTSSR